jgi:hypothetical protein
MPQDPAIKSAETQPVADAPAKELSEEQPKGVQQEKEEEVGDFITRHVLEKDSVFFEG